MKRYNRVILSLLLAALGTLFYSGCNGDDNNNATQTGLFIDAPVNGLSYSTPTHSGVTQNGGKFLYEVGEAVTFMLGNLILGTVEAKSQITPVDLIEGATDSSNIAVQNILRLLQTLDKDGNPENGIDLLDAVKNITLQNPDFYSEGMLNDIIVQVDPTLIIVSAQSAVQHFLGFVNGTQSSSSSVASSTASVAVSSQSSQSVSSQSSQVLSSASSQAVSSSSSSTAVSSAAQSSAGGGTATLTFDQATNQFKNLGNAPVTITNMLVNFEGQYNISVSGYNMSIAFSGVLDYVAGTVTVTASGITQTVTVNDLQSLYPMTVDSGQFMDIAPYTYDSVPAGASGYINYLYTFITSAGNVTAEAHLTF